MLSDKIDSILKRTPNDGAMLREAIIQIEIAFAVSAENTPTPDQLADLADAVDAFKDRAYGVAASLARAASGTRRKVELSRRPAAMSRSLAELRETYGRLRAAREKRTPPRPSK